MLAIESTFDLNDDEKRRLQVFADELFAVWTRTDDCDVPAVESAIERIYARAGVSAPIILWCDSPWEVHTTPALPDNVTDQSRHLLAGRIDLITSRFNVANSKAPLIWPPAWQQRCVQMIGAQRVVQWRENCARARLLMQARLSEDLPKHANVSPNEFVWGRWAGDLVPLNAAPALALVTPDDMTRELLEQLSDLYTLRCGAFAYAFRHSSVVVCRNPVRIEIDAQSRLHCDDSAAVQFADGYAMYCWAGVNVDAELVLDPASLTIERIEQEQNLELRRVMIEKYGTARFVEDSGAVSVAEDECGELLRKEVEGDEPILLVKVTNSTAEPDGTFKNYFLRVPPHVVTPREAVAWTFGLDPDEYQPDRQT